ncbi:sag-related sequence srs11 [Cystoisospora suis]|uniref:Sag-related sequence srs11 n=1 Tax=Cystoisospora suis TaxID=483139 RepID=A0A2C6K2F1_9APIC|nr:sag-related sequence srs11 [Cystoisospora suis]
MFHFCRGAALNHLVSRQMVITMEMKLCVRGGRFGVLVAATLFCLSASWVCLVRCESAKEARLAQESQETNVQTCADSNLILNGAESKVFSFRCKEGWKLYPVEPAEPIEKAIADPLKKVFEFTSQSGSAQVCGSQEQDLSVLVPQSELAKLPPSGQQKRQRTKEANPVYQLTLGPAPDTEKHLCYTCKTPPVSRSNLANQGQVCTIYITVPRKEDKPQRPGPQDSQQQNPQSPSPPQQQDPQPDQPSDSGTLSASVFKVAFMTSATSALGLMVHM